MKTILTFLLLAAFAEARIGETLEECIKRYGNPITVDKDLGTTTFLKEGFVVVVKFTDGKVHSVTIEKHDKGQLKLDFAMEDVHIAAFLVANSGGQKWFEVRADEVTRSWLTADGKRLAYYRIQDGIMVMTTSQAVVAGNREREEEEKKKVKDF